MPHYPLLTCNAILLVMLSYLNLMFQARSLWHMVGCYLILALFTTVSFVVRYSRVKSSSIFAEMHIDQPSELLVSEGTSSFFVVHFHLCMLVVCLLGALASFSMG